MHPRIGMATQRDSPRQIDGEGVARSRSRNGNRAQASLPTLRSLLDRIPLSSSIWGWKAHILELSLIIGAYLVYLATRGLVFSDLDSKGLENARRIVSAENSMGFFWEPGWQSWILAHARVLAEFFNWAYIWTYWPIIILVGLVLYLVNRRRYYYYRTVVVINLVFALVVFMLFPVTSPFNLTAYFVNTIQELGPSFYGSSDMAGYYNTNAAMPSLHFSWTIILGVLFLKSFKGWFKLLGIAYPVMTFFAITITGNHFILDAVAGAILAGAAFGVMGLGNRRELFGRLGSRFGLRERLLGKRAQPLENWQQRPGKQPAGIRRHFLPRQKPAIR